MGDPKDKGSVVVADDQETSQSTISTSPIICSSKQTKCCTGCNTTKTPLWRGGPAGPKSLCNACGIKYNKKRRKTSKTTNNGGRGDHVKLKVRLMVMNQKKQDQQQQQHMVKRKRSTYERGKPWWNKLREEEQAAILLMAISCGGSLY